MGLRACRGTGADPAKNGKGGRGEIEMSIVFLNTILIPILIRYSRIGMRRYKRRESPTPMHASFILAPYQ